MKIVEDTSDRLVIQCRRLILADFGFLFFILFGATFTVSMAYGEMGPLKPFFLLLGVGFTVIGALGIVTNGATRAVFDATRQMLLIDRRGLFGTRTQSLPFSDIARVWVHEDDDMHTLEFRLTSEKRVLLENTFTGNRAAFDIARRAHDWMELHQAKAATT